MNCDRNTLLLYAVTDRAWSRGTTLYKQVESALKGGATCVQLREKNLSQQEFLSEAVELRALCKKYNVPFIVNDNVEIAIRCGADGIHVGQEDMAAKRVRELVGKDMIVGVSAHSIEEALRAQQDGADYLGVGAIFSTATKENAEPLKLETLHDICESVDIPVVAIGGLNKSNISQLKNSDIDGVALVSAIFAAQYIEKECRELSKIIKATLNKHDNEEEDSL